MKLKFIILAETIQAPLPWQTFWRGDIVDVQFGDQGPETPTQSRFWHVFVDNIPVDPATLEGEREMQRLVTNVLVNASLIVVEPGLADFPLDAEKTVELEYEEANGYPPEHPKYRCDWYLDWTGVLTDWEPAMVDALVSNRHVTCPSIASIMPHVVNKNTGLPLTMEDFS